jgi:hypothetical protein
MLKFISGNVIGVKGAAKLGEAIKKLLNLTNLALNF